MLHLGWQDTADRTSWKESLEELGAKKFNTDDSHRLAFKAVVDNLRFEAKSLALDGNPHGIPIAEDFFEQLARVAGHAKPGSDGLPGIVWQHAPPFLKAALYEAFVDRIKDVDWNSEAVVTWDNFELVGIRKHRQPRELRDCSLAWHH